MLLNIPIERDKDWIVKVDTPEQIIAIHQHFQETYGDTREIYKNGMPSYLEENIDVCIRLDPYNNLNHAVERFYTAHPFFSKAIYKEFDELLKSKEIFTPKVTLSDIYKELKI